MARIEKLTDAQIAKFGDYVKRWTEIGLCTDPADRPRAEAAINEMYRQAGIAPPQKIVWCGSPLAQGMTRATILDKRVGDSVRASVRDSVRDSVGDSVWASVRASVGDSVWASVWASVGASVGDSVWDSVYGQHDASWLAFYRFFRGEVGLSNQTAKLEGLWDLSQSAGWALPHRNICWVSERHNILQRDERGRLHSVAGPACAFPDGWAIYAINGTRVPAKWIEQRGELSVSDVFAERNAETRRAGCTLLGWERVLAGIDAKLINDDGDPQIGALYEGQIPGAARCGFLRVECGTRRQFVIPVPAGLKTAIEAQAWVQNVPESKWIKPEVRG